MSGLTERVKDVVNEYLHRQDIVAGVTESESLRDRGVTSLQLVTLIFAVERAFDVTIPGEAITQSNFDSVEAIARTLGNLNAVPHEP